MGSPAKDPAHARGHTCYFNVVLHVTGPLIFSSPDHHPLPGSDSDDNTSDEYERPDFLCSVLQENMADEAR